MISQNEEKQDEKIDRLTEITQYLNREVNRKQERIFELEKIIIQMENKYDDLYKDYMKLIQRLREEGV